MKHTEDTFGLFSATYMYQYLLMIRSYAGHQIKFHHMHVS